MEDAHIAQIDIKEGYSIFGVFDGHGGKGVALYIDKYFKSILVETDGWKKEDYEKALQETCYKIDENMRKKDVEAEMYYLENPDNKDYPLPEITRVKSGATVTLCLITPTEILVGNAGDSRTICCVNGKKAKELSFDHKPDDPKEEERINAAGQEV
jgi:serine/threonine protein phosphatase PrpC